MSRYCLDTVAYSHFIGGKSEIVNLLDRADSIGVPVIVIGELCAGFARGSRVNQNLLELDEFLASPVVEVLPIERNTATIYGEIVAELRLYRSSDSHQ